MCHVKEGTSRASQNILLSSLDPLCFQLYIGGAEGSRRRNGDACGGLLLSVCASIDLLWGDALSATMAGTRLSAPSRLSQQISKARGRLYLDSRLHGLLGRMASAGAMTMAILTVAVVARRLVLV